MEPTDNPKYIVGQKVDLFILRETDLGFVARINGQDEGLLYHNEIFKPLVPKTEVVGYINRIRPDGSIDLILQPLGSFGSDELGQKILEALKHLDGFLPITDKSPAEMVYDFFGVSKKKYKMAIGGLYKKRLIRITDRGVELIDRSK